MLLQWIDASILTVYMFVHVTIGAHFMRKNTDQEDCFVGVRDGHAKLAVITFSSCLSSQEISMWRLDPFTDEH